MEQEQKAYDANIIAPVLYHETLSNTSKLLYGMIRNLTKQKGYAFAHNTKLAKDLHCSESTVRKCMKELEDAGFIRRDLTYTDQDQSIRKIYLIGDRQNTTWDPGRFLPDPPVENYRHKEQSKEQIKKRIRTSRKKTIDPFLEQAISEAQQDARDRWNSIIALWQTAETASTLERTFQDYFVGLDKEIQIKILEMIQGFGPDVVYLYNSWISQAFKTKTVNGQSLSKDIEKAKKKQHSLKPNSSKVLTQDNF